MNSLISLSKAGIFATLVAAAASKSCNTESGFEVTFYGYADNDPPGADIAYDCGRGYKAGGTGTYNDPLTFATAPGEFAKCDIIYLPYLQKYLRFEDECEQCTSDYKDGKLHIDIWTGPTNSNGGSKLLKCEDSLTPSASQIVVTNPPNSLTLALSSLLELAIPQTLIPPPPVPNRTTAAVRPRVEVMVLTQPHAPGLGIVLPALPITIAPIPGPARAAFALKVALPFVGQGGVDLIGELYLKGKQSIAI
ncbi:hypothetical protein EYZ11_007760 [Aspergillus tanneri]|uniref:Chitin-binding type-4 domain-containing protein n=1 Tax=Aspergillus tanneri TaxID=1220188 RepID=A0A4S3JEG0_9EURO|nr:uncharacterized protein ATNIH1004_002120 [Aspergillus tanneri]KAA8649449.1 hypothetical protein ATNIH1004_002120 [Aspergillus tanneri]THC92768.1 hypothetical protein EYZ11_007760 [Aspergillus tanneri]